MAVNTRVKSSQAHAMEKNSDMIASYEPFPYLMDEPFAGKLPLLSVCMEYKIAIERADPRSFWHRLAMIFQVF